MRKKSRKYPNCIKEKLREMGKNQAWLVRETGLSRSYISRLVQNKILNPAIQRSYIVAKALSCDIEDLWEFE